MEKENVETKREKIKTDYTGYSEVKLDLAIDMPVGAIKQGQKKKVQQIYQNKTKTIWTRKKAKNLQKGV